MSGLVDWDFAVNLGAKVAGDGPEVTAEDAAAAVAELRAGADRSTGAGARLHRTGGRRAHRAGARRRPARLGAGQRRRLRQDHRADDREARRPRRAPRPACPSRSARASPVPRSGCCSASSAPRCSDSSTRSTTRPGRLLLVAPNIVHVERELGADPSDFRLWVCLHEETHRVQFTAVPWMRDHLYSEMMALTDSVEPTRLAEDAVRRVSEAVRGGGGSLMDMMSTPEQREILDRITGVMSLLEGHADVVMDGVGPSVIPSVDKIRASFNERRKGIGTLDRILRRLLGLDAKMAQYRDGASLREPRRRQGRHGAVQRRLGRARRTSPRRPRSATPTPGSPGCCEPAPLDRSRTPRRARGPRPPRSRGEVVIVACSGGADSLALLSAAIFEGRLAVAAGRRRDGRPRAPGRFERTTPLASSSRWRRWVPTRP